MNRKALALIAACSLATTVGTASAANLDQVTDEIDLAQLADLILSEYLHLDDSSAADAQDESFALAIGFTFGVAFSSDSASFADALSEGLVLTGTDTGTDSVTFANLVTFTNAFALPGSAGVSAGLDAVAFDPPGAPPVLSANPVSPD
jgi:hypothetical protein